MPNWHIREVDLNTRARIKAYAARHNITIAQALKRLIDQINKPHNKSTP